MPADLATQRIRAERVEEAAELLRTHARTGHVRKVLRERYPELQPDTVYRYVHDAQAVVGSERARNLNARRVADVNEIKQAAARQWRLAEEAAEAKEYIAAAMLWKSWQGCLLLKAKIEHLDKISPLLGLESRETRAQLVEALRDSAHLLTETQRQELRDALSEVDDGDESVTTTLEAR
jgi:hypothetical protein